jgi:hypothetical protein
MRSAYITVVCVLAIGCGSKKELKNAKSSVYDTDFAIVYNAAVEATRELYPGLSDNPGPGIVKTGWHKVPYASNEDDLANQRTVAMGNGNYVGGAGGGTAGQNMMQGVDTRLNFKQYFVRFDVSVVGGRPWRVKVVGSASVWEPGNALPTDLKGPARPHWVEGRQDALTLAIYKRIKKYAIPMRKQEDDPKPEEPKIEKTDPKLFVNVPPTAAVALAKLRDALVQRNYDALRAELADDIVWSLGGSPGADTAMAMWQADSEALEAMQRVIAKGCASSDKKVICPPGAEPVPGAYSLVLEMRGDAWKVTSFVKAE